MAPTVGSDQVPGYRFTGQTIDTIAGRDDFAFRQYIPNAGPWMVPVPVFLGQSEIPALLPKSGDRDGPFPS